MSGEYVPPITAAMVQAGVRVLRKSGRLTDEAIGLDDLLVREVLHVALTVQKTPLQKRQDQMKASRKISE